MPAPLAIAMDYVISKTADSTYETESRSDLPRGLPKASAAEIGDSITIVGAGDRIKVTVLGLIDPAVIKNPGIKGMLALLSGEKEDPDEAKNHRYVAVKLRMRNLEDASQEGIVHGMCGGVLFDTEGRKYSSTGDFLKDYSVPWPPNRGEQPKLGCLFQNSERSDTRALRPGNQFGGAGPRRGVAAQALPPSLG